MSNTKRETQNHNSPFSMLPPCLYVTVHSRVLSQNRKVTHDIFSFTENGNKPIAFHHKHPHCATVTSHHTTPFPMTLSEQVTITTHSRVLSSNKFWKILFIYMYFFAIVMKNTLPSYNFFLFSFSFFENFGFFDFFDFLLYTILFVWSINLSFN